MRIEKFIGRKIHGTKNYNIKFYTDITFLTGINGSGKTTVVNCIVALMRPTFQTLASMEYDQIRVEFKVDKITNFIEASKLDNTIIIKTSGTSDALSFQKFVMDPAAPSFKEGEFENEYYKSTLSTLASHEVLKFIGSIPTPMFLGLDRRVRFDGGESRRFWLRTQQQQSRLGRQAGVSLTGSLLDAAHLAEAVHRDALISSARSGERLRRALMLELLTIEPMRGDFAVEAPSQAELHTIDEVEKGLSELHRILEVDETEVKKRIRPFLDAVRKLSKKIDQHKPKNQEDFDRFSLLIEWSFNNPQLKK